MFLLSTASPDAFLSDKSIVGGKMNLPPLGKDFFTSAGKENFTWLGKEFFTRLGRKNFTPVGKENFTGR